MKRWLAAIALLIVVVGIALYLSRSTHKVRLTERGEVRKELTGRQAFETRLGLRLATPATQSPPAIVLADTSAAPVAVLAASLPDTSVSSTDTAHEPSLASAPKLPPATVLENMRTAIRDYGSMFGENPVGNNAEITSALNGDNPKQAKFIQPDSGLRINGKGKVIDPWGTPLFFHQISGSETEIRSAGPDKVMWTTDDLIIK